jgi:protein gp37
MAENSAISWCDHTFNPWIGCARVSPACDGCYAAALMGGEGGRFARAEWGGPGKGDGTRSRTKDWSSPRRWNRQAAAAPGKTFVFCASLADVFDNAVPPEWRRDLFTLISDTPHLTWLLLTKRPGNIIRLFNEAATLDIGRVDLGLAWPCNAAIGCTVVNQAEADRDVPRLLAAKATLSPAFAFLSMEPLLGPVDVRPWIGHVIRDAIGGYEPELLTPWPRIDWIITGGETDQGDHKSRPSDPMWFRSVRDQCAAAGVPFHFKQWGEWQPPGPGVEILDAGGPSACQMRSGEWVFKDGKASDPCTLDGVRHDARPTR